MPNKPRPAGKPYLYRIRWANVQVSNGRAFSYHRMCIAERKTWLGWWPCIDADWTFQEARAERDIENDRELRQPLPQTKFYD